MVQYLDPDLLNLCVRWIILHKVKFIENEKGFETVLKFVQSDVKERAKDTKTDV